MEDGTANTKNLRLGVKFVHLHNRKWTDETEEKWGKPNYLNKNAGIIG